MFFDRLFVFVGGLYGAAGVALMAVAAHAGGANTQTAATFGLMHAPALLALGLRGAPRGDWLLRLGGLAILIGVGLFSGDLLMREFTGEKLFPMAAPSGGATTIGGWLLVAIGAIWRRNDEG
jgi:uncharacterized membrane protein YgdD (TMEM256/DUF423 family)